jgi:hypothetical protein
MMRRRHPLDRRCSGNLGPALQAQGPQQNLPSGNDRDMPIYRNRQVQGPSQQPPPHTKNKHTQKQTIPAIVPLLTDVDILSVGLSFAGFDKKRQQRVNLNRNIERFKSFYGPCPTTAVPFFLDLKDAFPDVVFKELLMTLNWFKIYDTQHVLSGRWGYCEEFIGPKVRECGKKMQSLKEKKIRFEFKQKSHYVASIDCSNFEVQEFRLDPSSKWFDHKSHSCGLVSKMCLLWCGLN